MFALLFILLALNFDHPSFKKLLESEGVTNTQEWVKVTGTGVERMDLIDTVDSERRSLILQYCKDIGLFDGVEPTRTHYGTALVHGAMLPTVQRRISHLLDLWNRGVRFDKVYFLAGDRQLRKEEIEITGGQTEFDMVQTLVSRTDFPPGFPPHECILGHGSEGRRANTKDNLRQVRDRLVPPVLAVSTPMYVHYQHVVALSVLGRDYPLETCAKEVGNETFKIPVVLDTLAKIIYETNS